MHYCFTPLTQPVKIVKVGFAAIKRPMLVGLFMLLLICSFSLILAPVAPTWCWAALEDIIN